MCMTSFILRSSVALHTLSHPTIEESSETSLEILVPCLGESIDMSKGHQMLPVQSRIRFLFKDKDLSTLTLHILPRLVWSGNRRLKVKPHEGNSQNTSTLSELSSKSASGFCKASIGYSIPLPKRLNSMAQATEESELATRKTEKNLEAHNNQAIEEKLHCKWQGKPASNDLLRRGLQSPEKVFSPEPISLQAKSILPGIEHKFKNSNPVEAPMEKTHSDQKHSGNYADTETDTHFIEKQPGPLVTSEVKAISTGEVQMEKTNSDRRNHGDYVAMDTGTNDIEDQPSGSVTPEGTLISMQLKTEQKSNKESGNLLSIAVGNDAHSDKDMPRQKDLQITKVMTPDSTALSPNTVLSPNNEALHTVLSPNTVSSPSNEALHKDLLLKEEKGKQQQYKHAFILNGNRDVKVCIEEKKHNVQDNQEGNDIWDVRESLRTPITDPNEQLRKKIRDMLKQASSPFTFDYFQPERQMNVICDPVETESEYHHQAPEQSKWGDESMEKMFSRFSKLDNQQAMPHKDHAITIERRGRKRKMLHEIKEIQTENCISEEAVITSMAALRQTTPFQTRLTSTPAYSVFYAKRHRRERRTQVQSSTTFNLPQELFRKVVFAETLNDHNDASLIDKMEFEKEASDMESLHVKSPKHMNAFLEEDIDKDYNNISSADIYGFKSMLIMDQSLQPKQNFPKVRKNDINLDVREIPDTHGKDLPENNDAQDFVGNNENCDLNVALVRLANLLQKFKQKVRVETKLKKSQILTSTSEVIQQKLQDVELQIKRDMDNHVKFSKTKFGQLQIQIKDEQEKLTRMHARYREELTNHQKHFNDITSQVETAKRELSNLADKQKMVHKKLLGKAQELTERDLAEAENKLIAVQQTTRTMQGLRDAIKKMLQEIR